MVCSVRKSAAENRGGVVEDILSSSWSVAHSGTISVTGLERSSTPERKTMSDAWDWASMSVRSSRPRPLVQPAVLMMSGVRASSEVVAEARRSR